MENQYVKSPFNYTGGKYKLLTQIIPLFPDKIDTFYDLFCGGCNVGVNVKAIKIICNDVLKPLIDCFSFFKETNAKKIFEEIQNIIKEYELSDSKLNKYEYYKCNSDVGLGIYNKESYLKLRKNYNSLNKFDSYKKNLLFYVLTCYSFSNQIRFNKKGEYNVPFGKRDFNINMKSNLSKFLTKLNEIDIEFTNFDFIKLSSHFEFGKNDFVYIDPPYSKTIAFYNENGGWNKEQDLKLFNFLDELNSNGIRFAMSNIYNTEWLIEWSSKYNIHKLDYNYKNCNYHKKDKSGKEQEILVTNY